MQIWATLWAPQICIVAASCAAICATLDAPLANRARAKGTALSASKIRLDCNMLPRKIIERIVWLTNNLRYEPRH